MKIQKTYIEVDKQEMPTNYFYQFKRSAKYAKALLITVILIFSAILCITTFYEPGLPNLKQSATIFIGYGLTNIFIILRL